MKLSMFTTMAPILIALAACSAAESNGAVAAASETNAENGAVHPVSGLKIIDLTVDTGDKKLPFKVELADTPEAQGRGLMFRTELGDNEGMIFPSKSPQTRSFWMKNTPLSLDIIFVGPDGRITNIAANTVPYSLESVASTGLASAVLELRAGRSAELGIEPGDKVEYQIPQ